MATIKKAVDVAAVEEQEVRTEPEFEYVQIPEKDLFGFKFHGVRINQDHYGPGTHKVAPVVAAEIRRIVSAAEQSDLRVMSPSINPDVARILSTRGINLGGVSKN